MSTYRDLFNDNMKKNNECLNDMTYWIGNLKDLDTEWRKDEMDVNQINLHIYTKNYVYFPQYFTEYEVQTHVDILAIPLPTNPDFKNIAI